jgi:hypothetical protein
VAEKVFEKDSERRERNQLPLSLFFSFLSVLLYLSFLFTRFDPLSLSLDLFFYSLSLFLLHFSIFCPFSLFLSLYLFKFTSNPSFTS